MLGVDYKVEVVGAMRQIMQQGDLSAKAALDTLITRPHLYALGPAAGLKGEIMVLDGVPYVCSLVRETFSTRQSGQVKAAMLVYAQVSRWQNLHLEEAVISYQDLETALQRHAKAKGIDVDQPFPFLLSGTVTKASYHVIDWQEGATHTMENHKQFARQGELKGVPVQLLGFYSANHHGVFTHH